VVEGDRQPGPLGGSGAFLAIALAPPSVEPTAGLSATRPASPWGARARPDFYFVGNLSLPGDLVILWRTARVLLHPTGAY